MLLKTDEIINSLRGDGSETAAYELSLLRRKRTSASLELPLSTFVSEGGFCH